MTFDKQVKEAKRKKLENRIIRDIVFIILGISFLVISFITAYSKDKKQNNNVGMMNKNSFVTYCI